MLSPQSEALLCPNVHENKKPKFSESFKCAWIFLIGIVLKLYDDLVDLYMVDSHCRFMSCIQTGFSMILCYWLFVIADTIYEIQFILLNTLACILDWDGFASDPYFFSITLIFTIVCIIQLTYKFYDRHEIHNIGFNVFVMVFVLCLFSLQSLPEALCIEFNGFFCDFFKVCGFVPQYTDKFALVTLSKTEREVSTYKIKCRIFHVLYLVIFLCGLYYMRYMLSSFPLLHAALSCLIYSNILMIGYNSLSVFNQVNVLYFHPEVVEMHKTNNNE